MKDKLEFGLSNILTIIIAPQGRGKKTLVRDYCIENNYLYTPIGTGVDDIRGLKFVITTTNNRGTYYVIENGDKLTIPAQNALLKVSEDGGKDTRIVILCTTTVYMGFPLLNRATQILLTPLPKEYIQTYTLEKIKASGGTYNTDILLSSCETYGDVDRLMEYSPQKLNELYYLGEKIISNIDVVSEVNALKIINTIKVKKDDNGFEFYDLLLVVLGLLKINKTLSKKIIKKYCNSTQNAIRLLSVNSTKMVFDNWIWEMRE